MLQINWFLRIPKEDLASIDEITSKVIFKEKVPFYRFNGKPDRENYLHSQLLDTLEIQVQAFELSAVCTSFDFSAYLAVSPLFHQRCTLDALANAICYTLFLLINCPVKRAKSRAISTGNLAQLCNTLPSRTAFGEPSYQSCYGRLIHHVPTRLILAYGLRQE